MSIVELAESWSQQYNADGSYTIQRVFVAPWDEVYYGNPAMPYPGGPVDPTGATFTDCYCTDVKIDPLASNNNTHAKIIATFANTGVNTVKSWKFTFSTNQQSIPSSKYYDYTSTSVKTWSETYLDTYADTPTEDIPILNIDKPNGTINLTAFGNTLAMYDIFTNYLNRVNSVRLLDYLSGVVNTYEWVALTDENGRKIQKYRSNGEYDITYGFGIGQGIDDIGKFKLQHCSAVPIVDGYFQFDFVFEQYTRDSHGGTLWNSPFGIATNNYQTADFTTLFNKLDTSNPFSGGTR